MNLKTTFTWIALVLAAVCLAIDIHLWAWDWRSAVIYLIGVPWCIYDLSKEKQESGD